VSRIRTNFAAVRKMRARLAESLYTITLPSGEEVTYNDQGGRCLSESWPRRLA